MVKNYLILILFLIFITGCSFIQSGNLFITVANNEKPIENSVVTLLIVDDSSKKGEKVFKKTVNTSGKAVWNIDFSKVKSIKVTAQNNSLDKIYLPEIQYISIPSWWQFHDIYLTMNLHDFSLHKPIKSKFSK